MDRNTIIKYALIGAGVLLIFYIFSRAGSGSSSGDAGAIAVDVEYMPTGDAGAAIAARASAFSELVGLGAHSISEAAGLEATRMANVTARQISSEETALGKYELDTGRTIEAMRIRGAQELTEAQARQVNMLAESFRGKSEQKTATVLNALTSIWGAGPTYPERSTGGATGILNAIAGIVGGLSGFFNPVSRGMR